MIPTAHSVGRSVLLCGANGFSKVISVPSTQVRPKYSFAALKIYSVRRRIAEYFSNKFYEQRVNEIGPDLACLEWLMECGSTEVTMSDDERITSIRKMKNYIEQRLEEKEIVLNPALTDGAVYWLSRLKALRRAHFYFLPYVANRQSFLRQLKLALPRCKVTFPEAIHIGYGYEDEKQPKN
ncbi:hypothetical protein TELCIR_14016 [Teladorsagia circumcincta]|uniref:Uncharacterized protein n=1 Tax=Teladorsagia circumcincta TaxID=45464 RepID=A0A2G9U4D0_TELCI|nr:hypothetical protein TELCIR_14016 [Teladorsagia circumcincta]